MSSKYYNSLLQMTMKAVGMLGRHAATIPMPRLRQMRDDSLRPERDAVPPESIAIVFSPLIAPTLPPPLCWYLEEHKNVPLHDAGG